MTTRMTKPTHLGSVAHDDAMSRRRFLQQIETVAGTAICASLPLAAVSACAGRVRYVTPTAIGDRLAVPLARLTATGSALVENPRDELPIFLRRTSAAELTAVSTRCEHRGCQVDPSADRLVCPCHGSEYTFAGAVLQGPTERPLRRFRVTTDETSAYIHLADGPQ